MAALQIVPEQRLVLTRGTNRTHTDPAVAVVAVHVVVARIEEEAPRVVRVVCVERTRPVVAVAACVVETAIVAVAGGRKEEKPLKRQRSCCFRGRKNASVQANCLIGVIPQCGPTACELTFVIPYYLSNDFRNLLLDVRQKGHTFHGRMLLNGIG